MSGQSWISGVALDSDGNVVVAGGTRGADLPTVNATQAHAGLADAFVAKIAGNGSGLLYSTYLGGTGDDGGLAVSLDSQGNVIAAGQTRSIDFPVTNPVPAAWGYGDAFVVKLAAAGAEIAGAVNGASYAGGGVAPGENITVFGNGLGPASLTFASVDGGSLARNVGGFEVLFDGVAAPMIYASSHQTSVMVPYEVAGKASTTMQVVQGGVPTASAGFTVAAALPGIYTAAQNGLGQGAILNSDLSPNSAANPARAGSAIAVYLTGQGQTTPAGSTGAMAPADGSGLKRAAASVSATVGNRKATVLYAGSAPTLVEGIAQVNIELPQGLGTEAFPLVVTYTDGSGKTYSSQAGVTVAVSAAP